MSKIYQSKVLATQSAEMNQLLDNIVAKVSQIETDIRPFLLFGSKIMDMAGGSKPLMFDEIMKRVEDGTATDVDLSNMDDAAFVETKNRLRKTAHTNALAECVVVLKAFRKGSAAIHSKMMKLQERINAEPFSSEGIIARQKLSVLKRSAELYGKRASTIVTIFLKRRKDLYVILNESMKALENAIGQNGIKGLAQLCHENPIDGELFKASEEEKRLERVLNSKSIVGEL